MFSEKVLLFNFLLGLLIDKFLVDIDILVCYLLWYLICSNFPDEFRFNIFHEERRSGLIIGVACR